MWLYHYTDDDSLKQILQDKMLYFGEDDSYVGRHGTGVFLTSCQPSAGRRRIIRNNFGVVNTDENSEIWQKSNSYIAILSRDLDEKYLVKEEGSKSLYVYHNIIVLDNIIYQTGNVTEP
ncbi:hypothetical protein CHUAL_003465 [Chamberlinius hualienensis]